jgi:hypothetical protein
MIRMYGVPYLLTFETSTTLPLQGWIRDGHCVGATMREKPDAKKISVQCVGDLLSALSPCTSQLNSHVHQHQDQQRTENREQTTETDQACPT